MRHATLVMLGVLSVLVATGAQSARAELPLGALPPPFIGSADDWINTPPVTWKELEGKVVLVDFWEYTCVNCIRTYPYLKAWNERYSPYGLVIVGIHRPEFDFAKSKANVAAAAKRQGLTYPILNDPDYKNWKAYHEHSWPSKYIFDQSGKLVDQHVGEGAYQQTEELIQRLLHKTHPEAKFPKPLPPQKPGDDPKVKCHLSTEELYTNPHPAYDDIANLPQEWDWNKPITFSDRKPHVEGKLYYQGVFVPKRQRLQHGQKTEHLENTVALRYRATEVNVVLNGPSREPYRVYVTLDGGPVPRAIQGDDTRRDARGTYIEVDAPRMYNLIRSPFEGHEIVLASNSPDFDLYSYTFSGCPQKWE